MIIICFSAKEGKALKKTFENMSNVDSFDKKVDDFMKKFDENSTQSVGLALVILYFYVYF